MAIEVNVIFIWMKKMKKKEIKITEKEQRVAADILQELEIWMMNFIKYI